MELHSPLLVHTILYPYLHHELAERSVEWRLGTFHPQPEMGVWTHQPIGISEQLHSIGSSFFHPHLMWGYAHVSVNVYGGGAINITVYNNPPIVGPVK